MPKSDLNTLVVKNLSTSPLCARDLFNAVRQEDPMLMRKGFRNFVHNVRFVEGIRSVLIQKGEPRMYELKKKVI